MRTLSNRAVVIVAFLGCAGLSAHSSSEARRMIDLNLVHKSHLVVKFKDDAESDARALSQMISGVDIQAEPLFSRPASEYQSERRLLEQRSKKRLPHLENYFYLVPRFEQTNEAAKQILEIVSAHPGVEFCYFEPKTANAVMQNRGLRSPQSEDTRARTGDYESHQFHLRPSPEGVDAEYAWKIPGGTGAGVKVIDVEYGWEWRHEDFNLPFWNNGVNTAESNHGTAVWGEIASKRDARGVTGISYDVEYGTAGWENSARTYERAAAKLNPGDLIIIEQHNYGPDNGKFTAMEYWQANFDAFKIITERGIFIVEAAGNGNSNFDGRIYYGKFNLKKRDSGAIMVGAAGAPDGQKHLERLWFSNYGSRLDVFGYGEHVVTTGYGNLFNGGRTRTYTKSFSGTSSATPIVTGVIAALQGIAKARGRVLSPNEVRKALRATGAGQKGGVKARIGSLPDLRALVKFLGLS